jgi:CubicO group peptidase (beta-lactamase class C family)
MGNGGFSQARLTRLHDTMAGYVERGEVPGIVTLVSRHGETRVDAIGTMSAHGGRPIQRDAIFRISSMTKPITAATALTLVDDGTIALDAAVDRWLPELADRRVMARPDGPLDDTVAAARPITVDDVLSFRLGWGMDFAATGPQPVLEAMAGLQLGAGPPAPAVPPEPDEWIRRLGTLPLQYQPGERACSTRSGWPTPGSP